MNLIWRAPELNKRFSIPSGTALSAGSLLLVNDRAEMLFVRLDEVSRWEVPEEQKVEALVDEAIIALASEAVGIMGVLNTKTLEYAKTREQFGVAIGSYQALQHRMVDTMMAYEQCKSLLFKALCEYKQDPAMAAETIHALKVLIDRNAKHVFGEAIQIHGGMGMTDELDIGHYAKRLMMINTTFGDANFHRNRFVETAFAA